MLTPEDRKLLKIIAEDCRLGPEELSLQTGLSAEYIKQRINDWEKKKSLPATSPL